MPTAKVPGCDTVTPLSVACAAPSNVTANSFTANGLIGGAIPAGAVMQIRYAQSAAGPTWTTSPQFTAVAGAFSHTFTNVPAGSYVYRVDVLNPATQQAYQTSSPDCSVALVGSNATCSAGTGQRTIVTIGDSLTAGGGASNSFWSWRGTLQSALTAGGHNYSMVGQPLHTASNGAGPDFDTNAWGGAHIDGAFGGNTGKNATDQITAAPAGASTVVIAVGYNNTADSAQTSGIAARYQAMYDQARQKWPNADIVLCTVTPNSDGTTNAGNPTLNAKIRAMVAADTTGKLKLADVAAQSFVASDYFDYTHMSSSGATKMGNAITAAVQSTSCFSGSVVTPPTGKVAAEGARVAQGHDFVPPVACSGTWSQSPLFPNSPGGMNIQPANDRVSSGASMITSSPTAANWMDSWGWAMPPHNQVSAPDSNRNWRYEYGFVQSAIKVGSSGSGTPWTSLAQDNPLAVPSFGPQFGPNNMLVNARADGSNNNDEGGATTKSCVANDFIGARSNVLEPRNETQRKSVSLKGLGMAYTGTVMHEPILAASFGGVAPAQIKAIATVTWHRLIPDNPALPFDPSTVNLGVVNGIDLMNCETCGRLGGNNNNDSGTTGEGRLVRVTAQWQPSIFVMAMDPNGNNFMLTHTTTPTLKDWLAANPLPFTEPPA